MRMCHFLHKKHIYLWYWVVNSAHERERERDVEKKCYTFWETFYLFPYKNEKKQFHVSYVIFSEK